MRTSRRRLKLSNRINWSHPIGRRLRLGVAGLALVVLGAGTAWALSPAPPTPKYNSLARQVNPIGAPGRALGLSRVVVQPGARIPLHMHQGTQISYIQAGTLTYHVKSGRARVMRGPGDAGKVVRVIKAGQTARIKAGQWLVEQPSDHHRAANRGRKKVVIYLATLLRKNAAPSKPLP